MEYSTITTEPTIMIFSPGGIAFAVIVATIIVGYSGVALVDIVKDWDYIWHDPINAKAAIDMIFLGLIGMCFGGAISFFVLIASSSNDAPEKISEALESELGYEQVIPGYTDGDFNFSFTAVDSQGNPVNARLEETEPGTYLIVPQ